MKPMLASNVEWDKIKFPCYASPKIDGIRIIIADSTVLSRTLKPIPNRYVQAHLGHPEYEGLDGEITVGKPNGKRVMQDTTSGLMSINGTPEFIYSVFDLWTFPDLPYMERYKTLSNYNFNDGRIQVLAQTRMRNYRDLEEYEANALKNGYEGVMLRGIDAPYKYNRSTVKEGYLLKLKRFEDDEAIIMNVEEELHNTNEATLDERGYTKRSSHKENLVGMGILGSLKVRDIKTGIEFSIGTGFTVEQRNQLWKIAGSLPGKIVKYKHFANSGVKEAPRFPVFLGFRDEIDLLW
jgi:DNA ligase-1